MKLRSPEFENNQLIPARFTCEGEDINPALIIENIPSGAKSLALIMDDPDAAKGMWVHWVVYDIPLILRVEENSIPGKEGSNDFGRKGYGGPCPFSGTHRYFFKLYALDAALNLKETSYPPLNFRSPFTSLCHNAIITLDRRGFLTPPRRGGTGMSRLSRGKGILRHSLFAGRTSFASVH